jgi:pimeloyl-ACP methyl ester carboxylesterase
MALGWPGRVRALVLDGCAFLTPELRAALVGLSALGRPAGEGLERLAWDRAAGLLREYGVPVEAERVWPVMIDYLETDFVSSGPVLAAHDLAARLALLRLPVLLLGAEGDSLAASLDAARAILPGAPWHRFAGADPVHFEDRAAEFVAPVVDFLKGL